MGVKILVEMFDDAGFQMKITLNISIHNALHCTADLPKEPQLSSAETYLLTLQVANFESKFLHQKMINKVAGWGW